MPLTSAPVVQHLDISSTNRQMQAFQFSPMVTQQVVITIDARPVGVERQRDGGDAVVLSSRLVTTAPRRSRPTGSDCNPASRPGGRTQEADAVRRVERGSAAGRVGASGWLGGCRCRRSAQAIRRSSPSQKEADFFAKYMFVSADRRTGLAQRVESDPMRYPGNGETPR
jgi:hypothetical protein